MLLVILPGSNILGSVCVSVGSISVGLVIDPVSLVDIAVSMVQLAMTVSFSVLPGAFVSAAIKPLLFALAVTHTILPLAFVDRSTVEVDRWFHLAHIFDEVSIFESVSAATIVGECTFVVDVALNDLVVKHVRALDTSHLLASDTVCLVGAQGLSHPISIYASHRILVSITLTCAVGEESRAVSHFDSIQLQFKLKL